MPDLDGGRTVAVILTRTVAFPCPSTFLPRLVPGICFAAPEKTAGTGPAAMG